MVTQDKEDLLNAKQLRFVRNKTSEAEITVDDIKTLQLMEEIKSRLPIKMTDTTL